MQSENLVLEDLLLDPNNYRLQDNDIYQQIAENRYHLERVQSGTMSRLDGLKTLRDSIVANGFLPIERIVVAPYEHVQGKFVVIEGNRRVAALRQVRKEYDAGVEIPKEVVDVLDAVPCVVVENDDNVAYFKETLMGIRHVGGILEWGGYQRAKLIADLKDTHGIDLGDVAQKLALTPNEVNRRYRAYKALQQMQQDEQYADLATAKLYPIFHEAVSLPVAREWLGWDGQEFKFLDIRQLEHFYELITPRLKDEDGGEEEPKINTYMDVRALRDILPNPEAKADLLDMKRNISDALSIARTKEMSKRWRVEVNDANTALNNIGALEVKKLVEKDWLLIQELAKTTNSLLELKPKN